MNGTVPGYRSSIYRQLSFAWISLWLAAGGCAQQVPGAPAAKEPEGCRVTGRIVSTEWRELGGGIEPAIGSAWDVAEQERVEENYADGERFEIRLPPGKYRLMCSANGTRGATFEVQLREITIAENQ